MLAPGLRIWGGGGGRGISPFQKNLRGILFQRGILITCKIYDQLFPQQIFSTGAEIPAADFRTCKIVEKNVEPHNLPAKCQQWYRIE